MAYSNQFNVNDRTKIYYNRNNNIYNVNLTSNNIALYTEILCIPYSGGDNLKKYDINGYKMNKIKIPIFSANQDRSLI